MDTHEKHPRVQASTGERAIRTRKRSGAGRLAAQHDSARPRPAPYPAQTPGHTPASVPSLAAPSRVSIASTRAMGSILAADAAEDEPEPPAPIDPRGL